MTPTQLARALAGLGPPLQRALLAQLMAWERQGRRAALRDVEAAITRGDTREAVRLVLGEAVANAATFAEPVLPTLTPRVPVAISTTSAAEAAVLASATQTAVTSQRIGDRLVPPPPRTRPVQPSGFSDPLPPTRVTFEPGLQTAARQAAAYGGDALRFLRSTAAAGVRAAIEVGLAAGRNPRDVARGIRDVVGLGRTQAVWVSNLRAELEAGDLKGALARRLLKGPIRQTVSARARSGTPLTPAEIDKIVAAYGDKWRAWHAETVARTMTLDLLRTGQLRGMQNAVARGDFAGLTVLKQWVSVHDLRVRDTHQVLDQEKPIPLNTSWLDGDTPREVPGGWNCRCAMKFVFA